MLDVGCGHGLLVEAWRTLGVVQSYCIEGSEAARPMWPAAFADKYYRVQSLSSPDAATHVVPSDIVTTFEVAEHLPLRDAAHFVGLLTTHSPVGTAHSS